MTEKGLLHIRIVRATAAFRYSPHDIFTWIFNIAGFAVNAILGVNLKTRIRAIIIAQNFIDPRRASINQLKVARLFFAVISRRERHICQAVKGEDAVRLWIINGLIFAL